MKKQRERYGKRIAARYLKVLRKAREILSDKTRWTQEYLARDADGNVIDACSPDAQCFCIMGALYRAAGKRGTASAAGATRVLNCFVPQVHYDDIADVNDSPGGYRKVLRLLDKGIALLEEDIATAEAA